MAICKLITCYLIITTVKICLVFTSQTNDSEPNVCQSEICYKTANNLLQSMDATLNPCQDFYQYACANFIKNNPVPKTAIEYNRVQILTEEIQNKIQELLTSNEDDSQIPLAIKSAITFYKSCLDANETSDIVLEFLVDKLGGSPLITGTSWNPNNYSFIGAVFDSMLHGNSPFFSVSVQEHEKNVSANILYVDQIEMNIDVDYYLNPEGYEHVLKAYFYLITNVTKVLTGNEGSEIEQMAKDVIELEKAIANISSTFLQKQNVTRRYNHMTIKDLQNLTDPNKEIVDWTDFLQRLSKVDDITEDEPIIVNEPNYMARLFKILNTTDTEKLANYISWSAILYGIDEAWGELKQLYFTFKEFLGGAKIHPPKWEKCVELTVETFPYAITQMYVKNATDNSSKTDVIDLLKLLQRVFIKRLHDIRFMDNETRALAIDKVNSMQLFVAYPDWIYNNTKLEENYNHYPNMTGDFLRDVFAIALVTTENDFLTLRLPTKNEFDASPLDVNAFYSPTFNAITVPLAIIHHPFYGIGLPSAVNFGGLVTVLGHEVTHAFDNGGRKYDQFGNLNEWWPQNVIDAFEKKSKCFVRQYARCCPLYDEEDDSYTCVDGEQTLAENIADNGGMEVAYQAWKEWTKIHGEDSLLPGMENFTSAQIFFLNHANVWCETSTDGSLRGALSGDEHAPFSCNVNGAVANSEDFAKAFNCPRTSPMNRGRKRCTIW